VKFLVDANLPPRLCIWLRSQRHEAEHLFDCNLLTATDTQIWDRGRLESLVSVKTRTSTIERCCMVLRRRSFMSLWVTVAMLGFSVCWPPSGMTSSRLLYPDVNSFRLRWRKWKCLRNRSNAKKLRSRNEVAGRSLGGVERHRRSCENFFIPFF
jgi:Domain of unknown function (DUF5615)